MKRHCLGPRFQEVGKDGDCTQRYSHQQNDSALRWAAMRAVVITVRGKLSHKAVSTVKSQFVSRFGLAVRR